MAPVTLFSKGGIRGLPFLAGVGERFIDEASMLHDLRIGDRRYFTAVPG